MRIDNLKEIRTGTCIVCSRPYYSSGVNGFYPLLYHGKTCCMCNTYILRTLIRRGVTIMKKEVDLGLCT